MIDVLLLGTGGMMPLPRRWLSSLLIRCRGELILFDCGEGTQIPWRRFGWGFRRLGAICLSHYHADHVAGLPGLLHTLANAGRTEPVTLYGPVGTMQVVAGLRVIAPSLPYHLHVAELAGNEQFDLPSGLRGTVTPGEHGLPTLAYRIDAARARRFLPERAAALGVPLSLWRSLQGGEAVRWPGGEAAPDQVLGPPRRGLAIGYVTDTRPFARLRAPARGGRSPRQRGHLWRFGGRAEGGRAWPHDLRRGGDPRSRRQRRGSLVDPLQPRVDRPRVVPC